MDLNEVVKEEKKNKEGAVKEKEDLEEEDKILLWKRQWRVRN